MRTIAILILLALISGCDDQKPIYTRQVTPSYQVSFLFEHEGCRVYEFEDGGYPHYFTNCNGSVSWRRLEGKIKRPVEVITNVEENSQDGK